MSKSAVVVVVVLAAALAAGAGYWYGTRGPGAGEAATAAAGKGPGGAAPDAGREGMGGGPGSGGGTPVEVAKVTLVPLPLGITAVGSLRSDESVTLRPEVAGRISEILFREGQRVEKGQALVRLDASVTRAELEQAKTNVWLAKSKFDRAVELKDKGFISGQARDEAEGNYLVAQSALQLAEAKLAKTEIKAPFSGTLGLRQVSVGDYVKEGQDMVNLEAIDPLKVDFRVPEIFLRQVAVGQSLLLNLDAMPGASYEGRILAINPLLDASGRSIVIRAGVKNADQRLRPGMFARVRLLVGETRESLVVPEQALVPLGEEQFVYRVLDGRAVRTKVEIGQRREGMAEVLAGLNRDEVVVTAGQIKLRDGAPVAVAAAAAPADAAADKAAAGNGALAPKAGAAKGRT